MKQTIEIDSIRYSGQVSDPLGDMLARIRNGSISLHDEVAMPASKLLTQVARIMTREGYLDGWRVEDGRYCKVLVVKLKYTNDRRAAIKGMKRVSKPGLRQYAPTSRLPKVIGGLGVAIMTTSKGVMTSKEAAGHKVGGEVLCHIW